MSTNIGGAGTELLSLPNMATVTTTPGNRVSYLGQSMAPNSVFPKVPQLEMYARGVGRNVVTKLSGHQGTLEVTATLGAVGSARALCFLTDEEGGGNAILLYVGSANEPNVTITDKYGTVVAQTDNATALGTGARIVLRVAWDSRYEMAASTHAVVTLNGVPLTYSTEPITEWEAFRPNLLMLAGANSTFSVVDANGIVEIVQASNLPSP